MSDNCAFRLFRSAMSGGGGGGGEAQDNPCAICLESIKDRAKIECVHEFCFMCISAWAVNTNSCPLCKVAFRAIQHQVAGRTVKARVKEQKQIAEWDSEEIARFEDVGSGSGDDEHDSIEHSGTQASIDEYETGSFVAGDDESVGVKSDASIEIIETRTRSGGRRPRVRPPTPPRRRLAKRRRVTISVSSSSSSDSESEDSALQEALWRSRQESIRRPHSFAKLDDTLSSGS